MFEPLPLPCVTRLAQRLQRPIVFFDLETTAFVNATNFGITELGAWRVMPNGQQAGFARLINPENPFSPNVEEITGISAAMVANEPAFPSLAEAVRNMLEHCLTSGFNIREFDVPGLRSQFERYGLPLPPHGQILDVREVYVGWHKPKNNRGKLVEVAELYGCAFDGAHRAMADTLGSAKVLEAMLAKEGEDAVMRFITTSDVPSLIKAPWGAKKPEQDADREKAKGLILSFLQEHPRWNLSLIVEQSGMKPAPFSFAMADLMKEGRVTLGQIQDVSVQTWLDEQWAVIDVFDQRLKPMLEKAQTLGAPPDLDYIQLRVALARRESMVKEAEALSSATAADLDDTKPNGLSPR